MSTAIFVTALFLSNTTIQLHFGDSDCRLGAACAIYEDTYVTLGWSKLYMNTSATLDPMKAMYAAGYLEGALTAQSILDFYDSTVAKWSSIPVPFLKTQVAWMQKQSELYANVSTYWFHVGVVLEQLRGIVDGVKSLHPTFTYDMGMALQYVGDVTNIADGQRPALSRCSVLFKLLESGEVLVGHSTWDSYFSMLRVLKSYTYGWGPNEPLTVVLSASPGVIFSWDDFYITSRGLIVAESTFTTRMTPRWALFVTPETAPTWMRSVVANMVGTTAAGWAETFSRYNSGTYNNMWMVLDTKNLSFVVLEQLPGFVVWRDMTPTLRKDTFWASFNEPSLPETIAYGSFAKSVDARSKIMPREQAKVVDIASMQRAMRYNDYRNDPFSSSACDGISARCDLNVPPTLFGGTDSKVTSSKLVESLTFYAQNGPTHDTQPPFTWSGIPPRGHVRTFNFDWITFNRSAPVRVYSIDTKQSVASSLFMFPISFWSAVVLVVCLT